MTIELEHRSPLPAVQAADEGSDDGREGLHHRLPRSALANLARPVHWGRAREFTGRSQRRTTHTWPHDRHPYRSVCKGMTGSFRSKPSRFVYFGSEVLTEIVPPRLVADEQQPIGQHANPLAIGTEGVVVHLEGHHMPSSTTNYHAARYLRVAARRCACCCPKTCLRSSTEWRTSRHEQPKVGGLALTDGCATRWGRGAPERRAHTERVSSWTVRERSQNPASR
jgi:hypothetical protein